MDKLCETINRQCCLHCEMECDGKWLETEIEMYKEDLLKKQADKITDLEAKLAESEKQVKHWHDLYNDRDNQFQSVRQRYHLLNRLQAKYDDKNKLHLSEMHCLELVKENEQLKDKLEIKLEELHIAYCGIENVKTKNGNLKAEVKELKQQLAEKEQAIESLQEINQSLGQTCNNDANEIERLREQLAEKEKEETKRMEDFEKGCQEYYKSNQTAIAELEKLNEEFNQPYADDVYTGAQIEIIINEQIAELKGEK